MRSTKSVFVLASLGIVVACMSPRDEDGLLSRASAVNGENAFASPFCSTQARADHLEDWECQPGQEIKHLYFVYDDPKVAARVRSTLESNGVFVFSLYFDGWNEPRQAVGTADELGAAIRFDDQVAWGYVPAAAFCDVADGESVTPIAMTVDVRASVSAAATRLFGVGVMNLWKAEGERREPVLQTAAPEQVVWRGASRACSPPGFSKPLCNRQSSNPADWECTSGQSIDEVYFQTGEEPMRRLVENLQRNASLSASVQWRATVTVSGSDGYLYCATAAVSTDEIAVENGEIVYGSIPVSQFAFVPCAGAPAEGVVTPADVVLYDFTLVVEDPFERKTVVFELEPESSDLWVRWP